MTDDQKELVDAMWANNRDLLDDQWPCVCCCRDHFFDGCPARRWGGCRAQREMTLTEEREWREWAERQAKDKA